MNKELWAFSKTEKCNLVPGDLVVVDTDTLMFPYVIEKRNLDVDFAKKPLIGIIVSIFETRISMIVLVDNILYCISSSQISLV